MASTSEPSHHQRVHGFVSVVISGQGLMPDLFLEQDPVRNSRDTARKIVNTVRFMVVGMKPGFYKKDRQDKFNQLSRFYC